MTDRLDFECPYGLPWDWQPTPTPESLASLPSQQPAKPTGATMPIMRMTARPGDMLASLIKSVTGLDSCGPCDRRRQQMNDWGWWECWKRRGKICEWLAAEAKSMGIERSEAEILSLVRAAFSVRRTTHQV